MESEKAVTLLGQGLMDRARQKMSPEPWEGLGRCREVEQGKCE